MSLVQERITKRLKEIEKILAVLAPALRQPISQLTKQLLEQDFDNLLAESRRL